MQCYTELIPPSTVTHAVSLSFLSSSANNLVVAKTSLLQVFHLHESTKHLRNEATEQLAESKLVLIGEYPLAGTVTSLVAVHALNSKSGGDALLIAFKDAKLSLVEWDADNYRLSTISIHYYEGDNVLNQPFGPSLSESQPILTVDPSSRCAALKFGERHLAILPFRQTGDEGYDAELDIAPPSATLKRVQSALNESADSDAKQTPYKASFVLPLTALDPSLTHPVHLSFLHEYREPTFGILSALGQPSTAFLESRKDILSYTVFTLDLEQRASTNLISVPKLPSDLWKVVPLPLPIGGALLIGTNEFVHVDQSGRTNAVAVNEFAREASAFNMADQSALKMKLEDCEVVSLDRKTGDLLIMLNDGSLAILSFRLLGRSVGGLNVTPVSAENGGELVEAAPSCVASLDGNNIFIGSEDGDSALLRWTKATAILSRKRSHAQMLGQDTAANEDDEGDELDDDDLYAPAADVTRSSDSLFAPTTADIALSYSFEIHNTLSSLGPINNICFGRAPAQSKDKLQLLAATGRGRGSRLAFMSRDIVPDVLDTSLFSGARNVWSVCAKGQDAQQEDSSNYDNFFFVYDGEGAKVYDIENQDGNSVYIERTDTEFEREGETLFISTLANGTQIVQCRRSEIRTYDPSDLTMMQIFEMEDEETGAELNIVHASFCDPYLLILRNDSSVKVFRVNESEDNNIEYLESESALRERKWTSACLYLGPLSALETVVFLLGDEGGLHTLSLPDLEPIYTVSTLSYLPAVLAQDAPQRRGARETLTELLVADLGPKEVKQPFLIVRSAMDDLTLYEPWRNEDSGKWNEGLRFRKVPLMYTPKFDESVAEETEKPLPLQSIEVGGRKMVHVPGTESSFIVKEASALSKILPLRCERVKALIALHRSDCEHGFGVLDSEGILQAAQVSGGLDFSTGWSVERMPLGDPKEEVRFVTFHEERDMYVVATCRNVDFYFAEDDWRHHEQDDISLRPQVPRYTLHLLSASTRTTIHSHSMPYLEIITSLKVMPLEVSEHTHEQKSLIVVGTSAQRGEDMPARGAVNVFEILSVVPEPERPESGYQLHAISREEVKGAVTAVEAFPGGMVGTAQGQKLMVRGLKEDGSCLPVAFLDAQCHTTQLKTLGRSGLWLAADAWKGLWLGGFTEEPYRVSVLGKSRSRMEVVCAEFLPFEGQLFVLIIDAQMHLHVLQYDPESPKSLSGTKLLERSTIHLGHFPSGMTLLPSTLAGMGDQALTNGHDGEADVPSPPAPERYHVLTTSLTGAVGLVTPVDEATYRRLGSIQTQLSSILEHAGGLNPRAYRAVVSEGSGARGVIDGSLIRRFGELGSVRRAEVLGRAGADVWELRSDLEGIGVGGLGYL